VCGETAKKVKKTFKKDALFLCGYEEKTYLCNNKNKKKKKGIQPGYRIDWDTHQFYTENREYFAF